MTSSEVDLDAEKTDRVKIFIVEDSEIIRVGLAVILTPVPVFKIVGQAADGQSGLDGIRSAQADLAIVDIGLPDMSGIALTERIKAEMPNLKVLMFTSHDDEHDMFQAFAAGADGYVVKHDFDRARLQLAILTVAHGKCWLDPLIARRILQFATHQKLDVPSSLRSKGVMAQPLTDEEVNVLSGAEDCNGVCSVSPEFLQRLRRFVNA